MRFSPLEQATLVVLTPPPPPLPAHLVPLYRHWHRYLHRHLHRHRHGRFFLPVGAVFIGATTPATNDRSAAVRFLCHLLQYLHTYFEVICAFTHLSPSPFCRRDAGSFSSVSLHNVEGLSVSTEREAGYNLCV